MKFDNKISKRKQILHCIRHLHLPKVDRLFWTSGDVQIINRSCKTCGKVFYVNDTYKELIK